MADYLQENKCSLKCRILLGNEGLLARGCSDTLGREKEKEGLACCPSLWKQEAPLQLFFSLLKDGSWAGSHRQAGRQVKHKLHSRHPPGAAAEW